jgi:hypothetical protein
MKPKMVYFCILLNILFLMFSLDSSIADFHEDLYHETMTLRSQIHQLMSEPLEFNYDLDKVIEASFELTSVTEIEHLFISWVNAFKEKIIMKKYLSENDAINLIYALHYWANIYDGLVLPDDKFDSTNLLDAIPYIYGVNLLKENSVHLNFDALIKKYDDANRESDDLSKKEFGTGTKEILKAFHLFYLISPDQKLKETPPAVAKKAVEPFKKIITNYFPDSWYLMIREYINTQNTFFNSKNITKDLLKTFLPLTNYEKDNYREHSKAIKLISNYSTFADLYFKKIDSLYRFYIFDLPVTMLCKYSYYRARSAKHWLDDKDELKKTLLDFAAISEFKFTVAPSTDDWIITTSKELKSSFDEKEYAEIKAQSKLTKEWYNLLPKVKDPEPDKKFE